MADDETAEAAYEAWARGKLLPMQGQAYLPKFLGSGRVRKLPYDLESILNEMRGKIRAQEGGMSGGMAQARSQGARQFKTLDQIRTAGAKQLQHPEEFEKTKKAVNDHFFALADKLDSYATFGGEGSFRKLDNLTEVIQNSYKRGHSLHSELRLSGYKDVPYHVMAELDSFRRDLIEGPTEYFEAKPQRIMRLGEFHAAVVPHDVKPEVLDALRAAGVGHVEKYRRDRNSRDDNAEARRKAVERAAKRHDLLLSEPEGDIEELVKVSKFHDTCSVCGRTFSAHEYDPDDEGRSPPKADSASGKPHPFQSSRQVREETRKYRGEVHHQELLSAMRREMGLKKVDLTKTLPKTETCCECSRQATQRVLWAEGMAYQPACDDHVAKVRKQYEDKDEFCGLRPIEKTEPLAKMALIHDDPQKPTTVYRIQDANGEGPYDDPGYDSATTKVPLGNRSNADFYQPLPENDFDSEDMDEFHGQDEETGQGAGHYQFAFEHPHHAERWFGRDGIEKLYQHGYRLKAVKASKVYRSIGGGQVFYEHGAGNPPSAKMPDAPGFDHPTPPPRVRRVSQMGRKKLGKAEDRIPGGLADKKKPGDFDPEALAAGVKVEMEHTSDRAVATEIAMDHLTEDPKYYVKLKTIEKAEPGAICAGVLVGDGTGRYLFGRRRDSGLWTLPAGHAEPGESPEDCARLLAVVAVLAAAGAGGADYKI